jgi:4-amino-4-deoxy-L-arabinose transferase-like glycosyltransferase
MLSVLLGAGVVFLAFLIARQVFPDKEWLWLTTAAFVAFLPQHVAMLAAVNNDSLAELLIAGILFLLVHKPETNRQKVLLGILLGLGFLTKATVYLMVPVIGLYLLWANWPQWRPFFQQAVQVFGLAGLIGLPWWLRNIVVYGGLDILGIGAHNEIVTGQPRTAEWIANFGLVETLRKMLQTTFQSFWGQFGWMGVVMRPWVYQMLLLFTLLTIIGLILYLFTRPKPNTTQNQKQTVQNKTGRSSLPIPINWTIFAAAFTLSLLLFLTYNLTFVQHQGRYLFPGLIPIALTVSLAWATLIQPISRRWQPSVYLLPLGLALGLFGLDLLALFRFIIPFFNG